MSFASRLSAWLSPTPSDPVIRSAYLRACKLIGPALISAQSAERRLAPALAHALAYCEHLVDTLPQATRLAPDSLASTPTLHAIFPAPEMLTDAIGCSAQIRAWLKQSTHPATTQDAAFHALLAVRRRDRQVFGVALEGNILRHDVPQTLLNLTDPTLTQPSANPTEAREQMQRAGFDSLLTSFAQHIKAIRNEVEDMRIERGLESTYIALLRQGPESNRLQAHARQIETLNARLSADLDALQPDRIVDTLNEHLSKPEQCLRIEDTRVHITRSGVIVPPDAAMDADTLDIQLHELTSRDRRKHVIIPVSISKDFAEESVRRTTREVQRAFLL